MSPLRRMSSERRVVIIEILAVLLGLLLLATVTLGVVNYVRLASQVETTDQLVHDSAQQNVDARYGGCISGDELRKALHDQAVQGMKTTPLLLALVPSLDTPTVRELIADSNARQLRAFSPRGREGCARYALAAVPAETRENFTVPGR